jgi:hypothetical protein
MQKILTILRLYWNPITLVLIWKVLRQAFRWYHYFKNPSTFGWVISLFDIFSKVKSNFSHLQSWSLKTWVLAASFDQAFCMPCIKLEFQGDPGSRVPENPVHGDEKSQLETDLFERLVYGCITIMNVSLGTPFLTSTAVRILDYRWLSMNKSGTQENTMVYRLFCYGMDHALFK